MPPAASSQKYPKPPITEAVIQIRFANRVDFEALERVATRLRNDYLSKETLINLTTEVNALEGKVQSSQPQRVGLKLTANDGAAIAQLNVEFFLFSRLAPYQGWDEFRDRATRAWGVWKDVVGYRQVSRVGVRYVNRLDVPGSSAPIEIGDYLVFTPNLPEGLAQVTAFGTQAISQIGDGRYQLLIMSGSIPAPLVGHAAFALDIDVSTLQDVPQNDQELWALIDQFRHYKNEIFERCITDRARELFQ